MRTRHSTATVPQLAATLARVQPAPAATFLPWGGRRIAETIRVLGRHLPKHARVMDLGSGEGHVSYLITRALPGLRWQPTDAEAATRQQVFTAADGSVVYHYTPEPFTITETPDPLPASGPLDAVTLFEVLEHLPFHPAPLLVRINQALKPGGLCILSTPNISSRIAILRLLGGGSPHQTPFLKPGFWYHRREYSTWEVRELLRWAGFEIEAHTTANVYDTEDTGFRAWVLHACLLAWALLICSPAHIRQLVKFPGSTQFVVARKKGAPQTDKAPIEI